MTSSSSEWIGRFAEKLDLEAPSAENIEMLLDLAGLAAHASQRTAAPISCWLAAKSGLSPAEALQVARELMDASEAEETS
jgi:hypothetical protein